LVDGGTFNKGVSVKVTIEMAYARRNPLEGLIFHSDRGSQYAGEGFRRSLLQKGFVASMSGKGNCYDNAHAESFFHTIKVEEVYGKTLGLDRRQNQVYLSISRYFITGLGSITNGDI
jgi:putative transposase